MFISRLENYVRSHDPYTIFLMGWTLYCVYYSIQSVRIPNKADKLLFKINKTNYKNFNLDFFKLILLCVSVLSRNTTQVHYIVANVVKYFR